ncbi:MAG TPA: tetratricopeptide repeat protein [Archaeoglobaceae archaeon]|nr:tetratricopeptide repeat protein [Archaeoglobaceae archaeon]
MKLKIMVSDAEKFVIKGIARNRDKKYSEAIESFDKAIDLDPEFALAMYNKGIVLDSIEKYEEALRWLDKALEVNSEYAEAWYNKGAILLELEKYEDALKCFKIFLDNAPPYLSSLVDRIKEVINEIENLKEYKKR